jgi:hypothetical protein
MTSGAPRAASLARWWVALYTRSAPLDAAADRQAEVASDLFEHVAAAGVPAAPKRRIGWEIAGRLVRGVPADLTWRVEVEQAPGRLRWHLRHPTTVYAMALLVQVPLGLTADASRRGVNGWSAAGVLGLSAVTGYAVVLGFGLVSLAYLRPSVAGLRRTDSRRVRAFLVGAMSFLWALAGIWRFVLGPLSGVSTLAWVLFGVALVAYLLSIVARAIGWLSRVDLRKIPS